MASLLLGARGSTKKKTVLGDGISVLGATLTGAQIGGALGALAGGQIDAALTPGRHVSREGPRLTDLSLQASQEGAPVAAVYGRVRLAGQVIWASRFRETATTNTQGGKGGSVSQTDYAYSISFAVGLCEGVAARIGRVWANGNLLDLSRFAYRFHSGSETQAPDPAIAEIEGEANAPAYRGLCYVVFEDMALADFGNRIPQLQFEIFRPLLDEDSLENRLTAVALIPGAGEFVYATAGVAADDGAGGTAWQNVHGVTGEADLTASLDDLQALAPNLNIVALVVGWFGDDLAAGSVAIRPGVETLDKDTWPESWSVAGIMRADAHLISQVGGRPAFGGTPSDASVMAAIAELKRRGLRVLFYPFLFMDIAPGGDQPAYPWRGRIIPAAEDQTTAVADEVNSFFAGSWGWRRMVLHYAGLCAAAGGVDDFLIGSELVGLTRARSDAATYPAVTALKTLAADVRALVGPGTRISYGADWSEYNNHHTGGGAVRFNLDPLWADANINFIGLDNYLPLADWRDGEAHLDAAVVPSIYDPAYLKANIRGGEDYDWYYASDADRLSQTRTPITDGLGKQWVWRAKDLWGWWSNLHYDRPDGSESATPTAYVPQAKPIVFTELGCPALNKGANQPNVFYDPKSSESALPHFSDGARDDLMQRRFLEAHGAFWADAANNPVSTIYHAPMVERAHLWCWDARPFPWFPALGAVWGDAPNWQYGHWLNGRLGAVPLAALVAALCERAGFTNYDVSGLDGLVTGYAVSDIASARDALTPLADAFAFEAVESQGVLRFVMRGRAPAATLSQDQLVLPDDGAGFHLARAQESDLPGASRLSYVDGASDYAAASVVSRRLTGASLRVAASSLLLVMDEGQATAIGERLLQDAWVMRESAGFGLPPSHLKLEPADDVLLTVGGRQRRLRLTAIADAGARRIEAVATDPSLYIRSGPAALPRLRQNLVSPGRTLLLFLDLPWLTQGQNVAAPLVGAYADPWPGSVALMRSATGDNYTLDATLTKPCSFGVTTGDFWSGPAGHWDRVNRLNVKLTHGVLASASEEAVFGGANIVAVQNEDGGWEVLQFVSADLTGPGEYTLTQLRRGRRGSEMQMRGPVAAGARVVVLDDALKPLGLSMAEARLPFYYRWGPATRPVSDVSWQEARLSFEAAALVPLAPCYVRHRWEGGDLIITWLRRDRDPDSAHLTQRVMPMSESVERYDLEICDGVGAVVRSFAAVPQHAQRYDVGQQAADFPGGLPNPLIVNVYQLSSVLGRGRRKKEMLYVR
ncbi:MAG: glycoside hydrolase/phage tail family protein [Alphaproteobacteria bacterium]|nr:glycoside hydrolase/phage tail family protein [Alphaproteobacteria bacterium]